MAYIGLDSVKWGTGPQIPIAFYYDYQRSGSSMQYKIKVVVGTITGASYFGYPIYTTISLDGTAKVSGYTLKSVSPSQWSTAITYETDWLTVSDKTTGTTSLTVRVYSGSGSSRDTSYSYSLYVAPAATTPAVTGTPVLGGTVTINLPRADSSFTHTLTYGFWPSTEGIIATGATTSASWTIPLSLANRWPSATSGLVTIVCKTYSGSTLIGSESIGVTVTVPDTVVPTIAAVSIAEATSGLAAQFAAYVQNKSTLAVSIAATGIYGSTITKYETAILGVKYTGDSFTSQVLTATGSISVVVTVTDSRGRTATQEKTITVLEYTPPQITAMSAYRVNTNGDEADDGERIAIKVSYTVASVNNKNTRLYSVRYKSSSAYSFNDVVSNQTAQTSYNGTLTYTSSPVISGDNPWIVQFELKDYFTTISVNAEIPTAFTTMDFHNTGKGIAIGKVSEKDAFEVAIDTEFTGDVTIEAITDLSSSADKVVVVDTNNKVCYRTVSALKNDLSADYVVEQGVSGKWTYRKWASGVAECWGIFATDGITPSTAWGSSMVYGTWMNTTVNKTARKYPFAFTEVPVVQVSLNPDSGDGWLISDCNNNYGTLETYAPAYAVARPYSGGINMPRISYYVIGKWK